jgi:protein-S-isoprenylcysteine O-methyltransferase Ste14
VLVLPLLALAAVARPRSLSKNRAGALLLSFLAALVGIAALDRVARWLGWWGWADVEGSFDGLPVDAWLGWAVLWGPLPLAMGRLLPRFRLALPLVLVAWVDLLTMPLLTPLVQLGRGWWLGELVGLALVALPAVFVGSALRLVYRAVGQLGVFVGLVLWLLPTVAFGFGPGSWHALLGLPRWELSLLAQTFVLVATPGVAAVIEFAVRGGGTPYPWDPPPWLVTTGPYAYVANPMQLSALGLLLVLAVATRSWPVAVAGVLTGAFAEGVAEQHERDDLARRFGVRWSEYRRSVRRWVPRWRPAVSGTATVWVDLGCGPCQELAAFVRKVRPAGLVIADAREHPELLMRVRYEHSDGFQASGLAAVARVAEHVDAGFAVLAWLARLPLLGWVLARLADRLGFGPRPAGSAASCRPPLPSEPERSETEARWRRTPGGA